MSYRVRASRPDDLAALPDIERAASALFAGLPIEPGVLADVTTLAHFERAHAADELLVAAGPDDRPVGFAFLERVDECAHLDELDVHPDHGRRGVGAALVRGVLDRARRRGLPAVTLTTFRDVPWNAPFYARLGFRVLGDAELGPELAELVRSEHERGLRREDRVVMRCDLAG
ncbi:MAG: GNAT family N-acetyltransferase [Myxococcota bacterium]|nr:GNAT family N-acetyltransferase [Myxococcota bacterium]